jgi:hypothetical protein
VDLFHRILDKNPDTRIKMPELRVSPHMSRLIQEHPWVTANGQDSLLSAAENTTEIPTVTDQDRREAIIGIRGIVNVFLVVNKFKSLSAAHRHTHSLDNHLFPNDNNCALEHLPSHVLPGEETLSPEDTMMMDAPPTPTIQVHQPDEQIRYLGVGLGTMSSEDNTAWESGLRQCSSGDSEQQTSSDPMVYSSPSQTHENIFEAAFQRAEDKIRLTQGVNAVVYKTWRSEELSGAPITNEFGRRKVELPHTMEPRWESVLRDRMQRTVDDKTKAAQNVLPRIVGPSPDMN